MKQIKYAAYNDWWHPSFLNNVKLHDRKIISKFYSIRFRKMFTIFVANISDEDECLLHLKGYSEKLDKYS